MPRWSKDRSLCIGASPASLPNSTVLPREQFNSVDTAIQALESGVVACSGYCNVFSARMNSYYVLWPAELPPPQVGGAATTGYDPSLQQSLIAPTAYAAPQAATPFTFTPSPVVGSFAQPTYTPTPVVGSFAAPPAQTTTKPTYFAAPAVEYAQPQMEYAQPQYAVPSPQFYAPPPYAAPMEYAAPPYAAPQYAPPPYAAPMEYAAPPYAAPQYAPPPYATPNDYNMQSVPSMMAYPGAPGAPPYPAMQPNAPYNPAMQPNAPYNPAMQHNAPYNHGARPSKSKKPKKKKMCGCC